MRITHNQTKPDWLVDLNPESLGTGAFLVPDVSGAEIEGLPLKVEVQRKITYPQCVRRAEFAAAFKWIPFKVYDDDFAEKYSAGKIDCGEALCHDYCAEPLCWCVGGVCRSMR